MDAMEESKYTAKSETEVVSCKKVVEDRRLLRKGIN